MHPIHIIQHTPLHGPGYLETVLQQRQLPYETHAVEKAGAILQHDPPMSALVLLGGPFDTHDKGLPWLQAELQLTKRAIERDTALLGHGFGAEIIAAALDTHVVSSTVKQIGWFSVQIKDNTTSQWWLEGMPKWLEIFKWHTQSFDLPSGAQAILKSDWSTTEAFALNNILAFEGHLEVEQDMLQQWVHEYADQVAHPQPDPRQDSNLEVNWDAIIQGPEEIFSNIQGRLNKLHQAADIIYGHWLQRVLRQGPS
jgi:GMP synthase (glutamine-hydrolysing)